MASKIFVSAGETSGDIHGANLIHEIRKLAPEVHIEGFGGERMVSEGLDCLFPLAELSVMGFLQVILKAPTFIRLLREVDAHFQEAPPDLCVLIDYPGFNFRIARKAKKMGIPVVYYISPQVWAWHQSRVKTMKRIIDHMLVILPFEEEFFKDAGIPVTYVGHPLFDNMARFKPDAGFRNSFMKGEEGKLVALMPGSRRQEVKHIFPLMLRAAKRLQVRLANLHFVIPPAESSLLQLIEDIAEPYGLQIEIQSNRAYDVMKSADLALVSSGTATLELAYFQTPMIILYKTIPSSCFLCKMLMKTDFIGLVNILGGREVVPEIFPLFGGAKKVAAKAEEILTNPHVASKIRDDLGHIREGLALRGTSKRVAEKVLSFLE